MSSSDLRLNLPKKIQTPRLVVRRTWQKDIPAIYGLLDAHAKEMLRHWHDYDDETLAHSYRQIKDIVDREVAYTVKHGPEIVGFRWLEPSVRDWRFQGYLTTGSWFGPNGRGQGFARETLTAIVAAVRDAGFTGIETGTRPENVRTQKLFKACGFTVNSPRRSWGNTIVDMSINFERVKV